MGERSEVNKKYKFSHNNTFIRDSKKYKRIWKHDLSATIFIWRDENPNERS